jgi:platelet-activating factor acetylhydrolase
MTDESLLATDLLEEVPDEHRPTDQWIAARLHVDHEFRTRVAAGVQRRFKRNLHGQKSYRAEDEVWMHFKPSPEQLEKWIKDEGRGEERVANDSNVEGDSSRSTRGEVPESTDVPLSGVEIDATEKRGLSDHVNDRSHGSDSELKNSVKHTS